MNYRYIGRFAPSPTGPLHAGSLVAAMASYLDARAHDGTWLVRIEDIDEARTIDGADEAILLALSAFGMRWDGDVVWQSRRKGLYQAAFDRLQEHVYPCGCTRREIADSRIGIASDGAAIYPGTCRSGLLPGRTPRAYRLRMPDPSDPAGWIRFQDRWLGEQIQHLSGAVGDFVLKRADGFWAYQLAVVVDDADQGITHVVRGADLLESTARQIYLQRLLQLPTPVYLHVPVVTNAQGEKLSKQTGATALDIAHPLTELKQAAGFLNLQIMQPLSVAHFWEQAIAAWRLRFSLE
ncbi:tRNA glutamyl-Q(34) synthetase GluQRS [Oxalobacteraceae bacterium R-40]|uniref:Glutamyl-Q tRNA(Asp) synthetase n=1 Tax=Keguizhuia sedimenti TaxID=3064264 RepID=A0ABU1BPJ3_9BURK|nr:tRNA glutamyl-Q(34) synthetase GluQRS [Oxalobacteraceae bacterium R-40]